MSARSAAVRAPASRGLTFRETMSGPFTLTDVGMPSARDAEAPSRRSAHAAEEAGQVFPLTLNATITIPDLATFVKDPMHTGQLHGQVIFEPLGEPLQSDRGVFRLFAPADISAVRLAPKVMHYAVHFKKGRRSLYLAGNKFIDGTSPLRLWSETTTLYTRLYNGSSARAPVIGYGYLRLGVLDLLRTLPTMRPTTTGVRGVRALADFGRFFASELWDSYFSRRPAAASRRTDAPRV
jgi:hypothetical protein